VPHAPQEEVVPGQAAPVALQQVQADGQDAAQHVRQAAAQLVCGGGSGGGRRPGVCARDAP
jgi:hypothetical protein